MAARRIDPLSFEVAESAPVYTGAATARTGPSPLHSDPIRGVMLFRADCLEVLDRSCRYFTHATEFVRK